MLLQTIAKQIQLHEQILKSGKRKMELIFILFS